MLARVRAVGGPAVEQTGPAMLGAPAASRPPAEEAQPQSMQPEMTLLFQVKVG